MATGAAITAAYESGLKSSSWHQLRSMAIAALFGIAQEVASRAVPPLLNYLTGKRGSAPSDLPTVSESDAITPGVSERE